MTDKEKGYVVFTKEMKETHTILVPNMLPMHFRLIGKVMEKQGYKVELKMSRLSFAFTFFENVVPPLFSTNTPETIDA